LEVAKEQKDSNLKKVTSAAGMSEQDKQNLQYAWNGNNVRNILDNWLHNTKYRRKWQPQLSGRAYIPGLAHLDATCCCQVYPALQDCGVDSTPVDSTPDCALWLPHWCAVCWPDSKPIVSRRNCNYRRRQHPAMGYFVCACSDNMSVHRRAVAAACSPTSCSHFHRCTAANTPQH
jgi:hypothetical protein